MQCGNNAAQRQRYDGPLDENLLQRTFAEYDKGKEPRPICPVVVRRIADDDIREGLRGQLGVFAASAIQAGTVCGAYIFYACCQSVFGKQTR
jgi:hypothetical protein